MDTSQDSQSGFGLGLLVGVVVGAAVALLFAPTPGRETRRRLRRQMVAVRDRVGDQLEHLDDRVRHEIQARRR